MPYTKETFQDHIKYISDTNENREILSNRFGKPTFQFDSYTYIEIDLLNKTWRSCLGYEWLYRNTPPLTSIDDLLTLELNNGLVCSMAGKGFCPYEGDNGQCTMNNGRCTNQIKK